MLFWEVSRIFSQFNVSSSACCRVGGTPQRGQLVVVVVVVVVISVLNAGINQTALRLPPMALTSRRV
jgi:hypothetical protein